MSYVKTVLTRLGRRTPRRLLHQLNATVNYLDTGRWMHDRGFDPKRVNGRQEVFAAIADQLVGRVLYLEFGVYEGESMREWLSLLPPDARLIGFDSFQGLPQDWMEHLKRGTFATGAPPDIPDSRVSFEVGLFDDTLPRFDPPAHDSLVVNIDSDLYSSAKTVLEHVRLEPGSFVYFDEFHDRSHERKAFTEFMDETGAPFECVVATHELTHIAFRRT